MAETSNLYVYPIRVVGVRVSYRDSPAHRGRLRHSVDFIVPEDTPIVAALEGIVVDVKQDSDVGGEDASYDKHGNYIEIKHSNGEHSIYEHIRKNGSLVKVDDVVATDQVIGYSGSTGWIAHLGSHLHFDVHRYIGEGPDDYETLKIRWKGSTANSNKS